jgi:tripartite-type tricarboxylate transporter receptor subunit TctC
MFYPIIGIEQNVAAKKVKILALGTAKRLPQFPGVPTMSEVGFPGFEETAPWVGMLAPAKTPPEIVNKLNGAMLKALAKPEVRTQLEKLGAQVVGDSPAQFAEYLKRDYNRWEEVIKAAGVKAEATTQESKR